MNKLILAGAAIMLVSPAIAQSTGPAPIREPGPPRVTSPNQAPEVIVAPGGPSVANSGPAATGTIARSGTAADSASNNTAETLNSGTPERALPNTGGGGGSGDSGGQ